MGKNTLAFRTFTARLGSISSSMLACIPDQLNVHEKHFFYRWVMSSMRPS